MNITPRYLNFSTCCSVLPLTCRIHCLGFLERHNTSIFLNLILVPGPATFHSSLVARSRKPIKYILKSLWRECKPSQYQVVRQKQTVDPAAPNRDTLVDSAVTVYSIHVHCEEEWWQHTPAVWIFAHIPLRLSDRNKPKIYQRFIGEWKFSL